MLFKLFNRGSLKSVFPALESVPWSCGVIMTVVVGLVMGKTLSISRVASFIVPFMCGFIFWPVPTVVCQPWPHSDYREANHRGHFLLVTFGGFLGVLIIGIREAFFPMRQV